MKKWKWEIDEEDADQGIKAIALVDSPATESDFIAFSKEKVSHKYIKFESDDGKYKQIVAGLAMIPEKEIFRIDPNTGEEYIGFFEADSIERIRNDFHKKQQTQNVNTDHDENEDVDAYLIESYILNSEKQVEDLKDKDIDEARIGAWFVAYKIDDEEVFNKVLEGEYNGFSVELYANRILESFKYNNYKIKNKFSMKNIIERMKAVIDEFSEEEKSDEVKLISVTIPEQGITISQDSEEWTVDAEIVIVTVDDAGEEIREPVPDGEYVLEDGRTFVVADGMLTEIKEAAPAEEEPMKEEEPVKETVKAEKETVKAAEDVTSSDSKKTLEELIDLSKDGYYTVEVMVENGAFSYGSVYANTWKELEFKAENFEARETEIVTLKKEIDELKLKIKEPMSEPKLGLEDEVIDEVDLSKLSNFERIAHINNLPVV